MTIREDDNIVHGTTRKDVLSEWLEQNATGFYVAYSERGCWCQIAFEKEQDLVAFKLHFEGFTP